LYWLNITPKPMTQNLVFGTQSSPATTLVLYNKLKKNIRVSHKINVSGLLKWVQPGARP